MDDKSRRYGASEPYCRSCDGGGTIQRCGAVDDRLDKGHCFNLHTGYGLAKDVGGDYIWEHEHKALPLQLAGEPTMAVAGLKTKYNK
jgi:hypothetical protein